MGARKMADPRTNTVGTQLTRAQFDAVEAARGDVQRSPWLRDLILKAVADAGITVETVPEPAPVTPPRKKPAGRATSKVVDGLLPAQRRPPPAKPRKPLGAGIFLEPGGTETTTFMPPAPAKDRTRCKHPGIRTVGSNMGTCPDCKHRVESGGLWAPECDAGTCGHG